MANVHWIGGAADVAQVSTATIDTVELGSPTNTFTLTVGDASVSVVAVTSVAATATALIAAANASTHPHMSAITWSDGGVSPTDGTITGTADTAGVPFVASLSDVGSGTFTNFSDTTASSGAQDWSTAANWSGGAVPVNSDNVTIDKQDATIIWGIDQNGVTLGDLNVRNNAKIGLPWDKFSTSADGATTNADYREYRQTYLKIGYSRCDVGLYFGSGTNSPPTRVKLEQVATAQSVTRVHATGSSADTGLPAMRLIAAAGGSPLPETDVYIFSGSVGLGVEPGDSAEFGEVFVDSSSSATRALVGPGASVTSFTQRGGTNTLKPSSITTITSEDGTLTLEGDFVVTTMTVRDGDVEDNHISTSGNAITTLNLKGGTLDAQNSREARTYGTVNHTAGTLQANDKLTITAYNEPTEGDWQITAS